MFVHFFFKNLLRRLIFLLFFTFYHIFCNNQIELQVAPLQNTNSSLVLSSFGTNSNNDSKHFNELSKIVKKLVKIKFIWNNKST